MTLAIERAAHSKMRLTTLEQKYARFDSQYLTSRNAVGCPKYAIYNISQNFGPNNTRDG